MPHAAQGGSGILVDGGPHIGGSRLSPATSAWHDDTFAVGCWLHAHRLAVYQPIVVEGAANFQIIGFGSIRLLAPFDEEAGTVACNHSL